MTLTIPDIPATARLTPEELRLELACALYARGKVGRIGGAELAGVDFFAFQHALAEREISTYGMADLEQDIDVMNRLFPGKRAMNPGN